MKWEDKDVNLMLDLVARGFPMKAIAKKLERTPEQARFKLARIRTEARGEKVNDPEAYSPTKPITNIVPKAQIASLYAVHGFYTDRVRAA